MKNKVITMCGSKKFQEKVMDVAFSLELKGNCLSFCSSKVNSTIYLLLIGLTLIESSGYPGFLIFAC